MDILVENVEAPSKEFRSEPTFLATISSEYELERGKPMPSKNHSRIQRRLLFALVRFEPHYEALPEFSLELEGDKSVPDISVYPASPVDWQHDEIRSTEPPLLTIEIVSPTQSHYSLLEKSRAFLEHGVPICWIVQPELEAIIVMKPNAKPRIFTSGRVSDEATGIFVDIEDIFY